MARTPSRQPTEGELEILNVLWDSGRCELGQVIATLRKHRAVAPTTVATMLKLMEAKELVERAEIEGARGAVWSAKVSRKTAQAGLLRRLLDVAFDGSAHRLVAHMLENETLTDEDRATIKYLLTEGETPKKKGRSS